MPGSIDSSFVIDCHPAVELNRQAGVEHLDYAELHVPIKIKENGAPPQPPEETQEWRMLEKVGFHHMA